MEREKVYVVTSGEYSDYGIDKVFKTKEMAQKYIDNKTFWHSEYNIEEYYLQDEDVENMETFNILMAILDYTDDQNLSFKFEIKQENSLDCPIKENLNYFEYILKSIAVQRIINQINYDEQKLKEKYHKVLLDAYAEVKSLKEIEGWNMNMIRIHIREKYAGKFLDE